MRCGATITFLAWITRRKRGKAYQRMGQRHLRYRFNAFSFIAVSWSHMADTRMLQAGVMINFAEWACNAFNCSIQGLYMPLICCALNYHYYGALSRKIVAALHFCWNSIFVFHSRALCFSGSAWYNDRAKRRCMLYKERLYYGGILSFCICRPIWVRLCDSTQIAIGFSFSV